MLNYHDTIENILLELSKVGKPLVGKFSSGWSAIDIPEGVG